jgi:hypothetical protein
MRVMNNLMIQIKVINGFLSMYGGFIHYNMYRENITHVVDLSNLC